MAKERNGSAEDLEGVEERHRHGRSRKRKEESSEDRDEESADERERGSRKKRKHGHRRSSRRSSKRSRRSGSESESEEGSSTSASYSESSSEDSVSDSDSSAGSGGSEEEERRRKRRRKDRERKRTKEKERRRRKKREEREKKKKKKKEKTKKKKKEKDLGKRSAVTNSWGRYGIIRETDMWNKRPEFTAWLSEVKKVNLESLANWEEKQMFKEFMEDHNTATFPSKKYYGLDAYHMRMMNKDMKRASKKYADIERTVFNDEELRRQEMLRAREKHKDEQVEALKRSMETGMAQAMKEQAQLKEEMAYQYKLGNFEAAAAIQRRLDPDIAM